MTSKNNLHDKYIAVIGASSGIGRAIALTLATYSPKGIALGARTVEKLEEVAREIKTQGVEALVIQTDVTKTPEEEGSLNKFLQRAIDTFGRLDVVVNSSGVILNEVPVEDIPYERLSTTARTNYLPILFTAGQIKRQFIKQKSGIYVVISSQASRIPFAGEIDYNSSKAGASMVVDTLDSEFKDYRTKGFPLWAIALEPGFISTNEAFRNFPGEKDLIKGSLSPEQFAKIVMLHILSPEEQYKANRNSSRHLIKTN